MVPDQDDNKRGAREGANTWARSVLRDFGYLSEETEEKPLGNEEVIRLREHIEGSGVPQRFDEACRTINSEFTGGLIQQKRYLPPHSLICSYRLEEGRLRYAMDLRADKEGPLLIFFVEEIEKASSRSRRGGPLAFLRRRSSRNILCRIQLDLEAVTEDDLQAWFTYLLSRLADEFLPMPKDELKDPVQE